MMPDASELKRDFLVAGEAAPVLRIPLDGRTGLPSARPVFEGGDGALGRASVAIGVFDGLHLGHRELLRRMEEDASARGAASVAVTFDPDPDAVLPGQGTPHLMEAGARIDALARSGVDAVVVVPFTPELASLDHAAFFEDVLFPRLDVASIHVGSDFRLGAGGRSTVDVIAGWCSGRGVSVTGHELVRDDGEPVSATRIRRAVAAGDMGTARRELGRRYVVRGRVGRGRGDGTGMGFPTANVRFAPGIQLPMDGVYGGLALVDGTVWPSAVNVGIPPMFADDARSASLEANLLGFSGDLYGREIAVAFDERFRPSVVFEGLDDLVSTVRGDIGRVRRTFGERGVALS